MAVFVWLPTHPNLFGLIPVQKEDGNCGQEGLYINSSRKPFRQPLVSCLLLIGQLQCVVHETVLENLSKAKMTQIAVQWNVVMCVVVHTRVPVAFKLHWLSVGNSRCWLLPLHVIWSGSLRDHLSPACSVRSASEATFWVLLIKQCHVAGPRRCTFLAIAPVILCHPPRYPNYSKPLAFLQVLKDLIVLPSLGLRCGWVPLVFDSVF